MVTVTLEKLKDDGTADYTMTFKHFLTWGGVADFPVVANAIPQTDSKEQILIKIMGNSTSTKLSWVMKNEDTTVVTGTGSPDIKTVPQQINFWLSTMRPVFIDDKYKITFNFAEPLELFGVVSNFKWDMEGTAPVSARCSFNFMEGDVIANGTYETDTPSSPLSNTVSSPAAGQLRQDWTAPENQGTSAIINYQFAYRITGTQKWTFVTISPPSTTDHTATGLASGTYDCTVAATNDSGIGTIYPVQTQVVA